MTHRPSKATANLLGALAVAGLGAFAWGALIERNRFVVRRETLPVLDPGARPLTILHLSDLHMTPWQRRKQEWVRSLAMLEPDLIVNTGDNLGHENGIEGLRHAFEPFRGIPGVFVNGSNDYFGPEFKNPARYFRAPTRYASKRTTTLDTASLESYFENELGWLGLNNSSRAIEIKRSRLEFFGVNDAHKQWDQLEALPGAIEEMRENVGWQDDPSGPEAVTIGLTHAPYQRVLNSFVTNGADVIFAGHTHGGQVRIPGLPALVTNCDIPNDQAQGVSLWRHARHAAYLNVSAGLGTSIYAPVRFACPPEAVLVTLTGDDFSYS